MKKLLLILLCLPIFFFGQQNNLPKDVKNIISEIQVDMENVDNPIVATYLGSEIGDYFYFPFAALDGKYLDFGNGKNNYSDIPFSENDLEINSKLIGKKFTIYWGWSKAEFYCCEGRMDTYIADFPSILNIEYYKE
jgi:hypothetical protein